MAKAHAPASLRWARLAFGVIRAVAAAALLVWMLLQPHPAPAITPGRVFAQVAAVLPLCVAFVFSDMEYRRARDQIRDWRRYNRRLG
jgi:hypothetical protein